MSQQSSVPTVIAKSSGSDWSTPPASDQLELALFGPGFGECAVLHLGADQWIVVDSCQSVNSHVPEALEYLKRLGRDPALCVHLVVATHWHDDHIKGLNTLVQACRSAVFSCSAALGTKEFQGMIMAFDGQRMIAAGSGVREVNEVFHTLEQRQSVPRLASASKTLLHLQANQTGHGRAAKIVALSPSDHEFVLALGAIGKRIPTAAQTQYRCPAEQPNLMSIALHIRIGETSLLLGADLEQHTDARRGWVAVLKDATLPKDKSVIFKVPHHGSKSSFSHDVWQRLVVNDSIAVTTPWVRGAGRLPSPADIDQLVSRTPHAYITAMPTVGASRVVDRPAMVQRQLREMKARICELQPSMGTIRLRNGGKADWHTWHVELRDPARRLTVADVA